jgi:hypothetical protein
MIASQIPPMWQRSPENFQQTHQSLALFRLHEWQTENPNMLLHQFVARYIDRLTDDLPASVILEITKTIIGVWENQPILKHNPELV